MSKPSFIYKCECGALTLCFDDDNREYYLLEENLQKYFPDLNLENVPTQETFACNHCVNNWGLDICACGSGEKPSECDCGLNIPYQQIGAENYHCMSAWI